VKFFVVQKLLLGFYQPAKAAFVLTGYLPTCPETFDVAHFEDEEMASWVQSMDVYPY
jgi:hypothetical protein